MNKLTHNLAMAIGGKIGSMQTEHRQTDGLLSKPLEMALPLIPALSGGEKEPKSYGSLPNQVRKDARPLLRTLSFSVAQKLLDHHPLLEGYTLKSGWSRKLKVEKYLKDEPDSEKALHTLRYLLWNKEELQKLRDAGCFDWDNGDFQLTQAIVMSWSYAMGKKVKTALLDKTPPSVTAYDMLVKITRRYPDHPYAQWVKDRHMLSWGLLSVPQQDRVIQRLDEQLAVDHPLMAQTTKLHLGIKYGRGKLVLETAEAMASADKKRLLGDATKTAKSWGKLLSGDAKGAKTALRGIRKSSPFQTQIENIKNWDHPTQSSN